MFFYYKKNIKQRNRNGFMSLYMSVAITASTCIYLERILNWT